MTKSISIEILCYLLKHTKFSFLPSRMQASLLENKFNASFVCPYTRNLFSSAVESIKRSTLNVCENL